MQRRRVPPHSSLSLSKDSRRVLKLSRSFRRSDLLQYSTPPSSSLPPESLMHFCNPLIPPSSDLLLETIPRPLSTAALSQQERARKICPVFFKKMVFFFSGRNFLFFFFQGDLQSTVARLQISNLLLRPPWTTRSGGTDHLTRRPFSASGNTNIFTPFR